MSLSIMSKLNNFLIAWATLSQTDKQTNTYLFMGFLDKPSVNNKETWHSMTPNDFDFQIILNTWKSLIKGSLCSIKIQNIFKVLNL